MPPSLERWQADFSAALLGDALPQTCADAVIGSAADVAARVRRYRRHVRATWRHALALAYPVVRALVGDDCFDGLAERYGRAHPSRDGDLNGFGGAFAPFIAGETCVSGLPYLGDVAAVEWAVHCAHYAADATPIARERLVALSPAQLLAARFTLHPACAWLASAHPVCSLWSAHQADAACDLAAIAQRPEFALVTRRNWRVRVTPVPRGDLVALDALRAGADMDDTISAALRADPAFEFAPAFVRWLDCAVFTDFELAPT